MGLEQVDCVAIVELRAVNLLLVGRCVGQCHEFNGSDHTAVLLKGGDAVSFVVT
jgi:hypothetical protein